MRVKWSNEMDNFLKENYKKFEDGEISKILNLPSWEYVRRRRDKLKLTKNGSDVGLKFGKLSIISRIEEIRSDNGSYLYNTICDCGNIFIARADLIRSGHQKSCGCLKHEVLIERNTTHNMSNTKFYRTWFGMRTRCLGDTVRNYSERGIGVSKEWEDFEKFKEDMYESFLIHENKYGGIQTTLDRIDVNGNYCKENCRWATQKEQANNKTNNLFIEYEDKKLTASQWSDFSGINVHTLLSRYHKNGTENWLRPTDKIENLSQNS